MLTTNEDALICDLAETYGIYDYRSLSPKQVATFSVGLRENSRIKSDPSNNGHSLEELILASILDRLTAFIWNDVSRKAPSMVDTLLGNTTENEKDFVVFDNEVDFRNEWKKKTGG